MHDAPIGLTEAVQTLKQELLQALNVGWNDWVRFELAPIELELQVVATRGIDGKIGWSVIGFGGKYENAVTQKIKLTLRPLLRAQDGSMTTDWTIAGAADPSISFGKAKE